MRYLSKQFETEICKSYRPFLYQDWEQERSSELFCVNYGVADDIADERCICERKSLAAQLGKKKISANVSNDNMKQIVRFYSANGVNRMCFQETPEEQMAEYYMRLGYFLGEGTETVNVAILEPDAEDCRMFSKHGIAFHILTNIGMLKYGFVKDGRIGCGRCSYDFLVLPSEVRLHELTEQYVREVVESGGNILLLGEAPICDKAELCECKYLTSTCTFGKIVAAQVYRSKNTETEIYTTYRCMNEMQFLYAANASDRRRYEQKFDFGEKVHSFLKLNLLELTTEVVPLTITLQPGEDAILMPYGRKIED